MNLLARDAQRLADLALAGFAARGFERIFPPLLLDADLILEWVGEDVRSRAYFLADMDGDEHWCLRIDHTIPTVSSYLESGLRGEARFAYSGESFRRPPHGGDPRAGAFLETGVEIIAPADPETAERDAAQTVMEVVERAALRNAQLVAGDRTLFDALIDRCDFRPEQSAAIRRRFAQGDPLSDVSAFPGPSETGPRFLDSARDEETTRRLVADVYRLAGLREAAGRSIDDIADRLAAKARMGVAPPPAALTETVTRFLAIAGPPAEALDACAACARTAGVDMDAEIGRAARRFDRLAQDDARWRDAHFSPAFGRKLHYYSGFIFELRHGALDPDNPLAAGGRYDALFAHLGGPKDAASMGAMVRPMRLARARAAEGAA